MIFNLIKRAKELFYNNSESGLKATDVQGAIDEVNNKLTDINNNIPIFEKKYLGYLKFDANGLCNITNYVQGKIVLNAFIDGNCALGLFFRNADHNYIVENSSLANQTTYVWVTWVYTNN